MLWLFAFLPIFASGQSYNQRFEEALNQRDTINQRKILSEWQENKPKDADLHIGYFNFYKQRYETEADSLIRNELLSQAFSNIDTGTTRFPNRLDMWLANIALLGEIGNYSQYTEQLLELLDTNDAVKEVWLWKNNAPLVDASDFLLQYVDNFIVMLYNRQDESLHPNMDTIANRVLASYPQHVPSLSNLAITALYRKDYESGITHLAKAASYEPTNTSVLSNLAYAYEQIGDNENAIMYYEETIKYGDAQTKEYARNQLEKLQNKQ